MGSNFKTYFIECCRQAPLSWRKGAVVMTVLISVALVGGLYLGWHLEAYPAPYFLVGTCIIAAFDIFAIFPYQLWKANNAKIAALEDRLSPKINLFLRVDPLGQTTGLEIAKDPLGQDISILFRFVSSRLMRRILMTANPI